MSQQRILVAVPIVFAGFSVLGFARHEWFSASIYAGHALVFLAAVLLTAAVDSRDYRTQIRVLRYWAVVPAVIGLARLFEGTPGHRGDVTASGAVNAAMFFAIALGLLGMSLFISTPRGQLRWIAWRDRAEVKPAAPVPTATAASPPPWENPPYFDK
jgi:hypothetical protein